LFESLYNVVYDTHVMMASQYQLVWLWHHNIRSYCDDITVSCCVLGLPPYRKLTDANQTFLLNNLKPYGWTLRLSLIPTLLLNLLKVYQLWTSA